MPRAGEGCGSSVGHEEPRNSRELPASPHRAHSEGQAETWPLSEILSREDKGENSSDDVDAGGWAFQFTQPACWDAEGSVTERVRGSGESQSARHRDRERPKETDLSRKREGEGERQRAKSENKETERDAER